MLRSSPSSSPTLRAPSEAPRPAPVARRSVPLPRNVLREEALTLLRLVRKHWEPKLSPTGETILEGFVSIGESRFPRSTADKLEALVAKLDAEDEAANEIGRGHVRERADVGREVHARLSSVAKAAFLRTAHPAEWAEARELEKRHVGATSPAGVAAALDGYANLLERHGALVDGLGGFCRERLVEARSLAAELRTYGVPETEARTKALFVTRPITARETHLLCQHIRHYAKFLYRAEPATYRQFTSVYLRVQRARLRRQAAARAKQGR